MMEAKIKIHLEQWPRDQWISLDNLMTRLTFDIVATVLFGEDVNSIHDFEYESPSGFESLSFHDALTRINDDCMKTAFLPVSLLFPFLSDFNI